MTKSEVNILATPDGLLLTEKRPWDLFREGVNEISDEFKRDRVHPPLEDRDFKV